MRKGAHDDHYFNFDKNMMKGKDFFCSCCGFAEKIDCPDVDFEKLKMLV